MQTVTVVSGTTSVTQLISLSTLMAAKVKARTASKDLMLPFLNPSRSS